MDENCIICGKYLAPNMTRYDAYPVADGQCCHECEYNVVLPGRIAEIERLKNVNPTI